MKHISYGFFLLALYLSMVTETTATEQQTTPEITTTVAENYHSRPTPVSPRRRLKVADFRDTVERTFLIYYEMMLIV